ncbi:hypothetical protein QTP86_002397 [Hemibagrus guttatus]|nr:hypothetical protein QTP86_002397 [Hemibagrus guttatus]
MPEPPQLPPFDVEEQRLYPKLLPGDRAPYPISKGAPRHPTEEAHFGRLYPGSYPFGHDTELMTIGDSMAAPIEPLFTHKVVDEGDDVTLSCSYKDFSGTVNSLQWYKQYPKSKPEFLFYILPSGDKSDPMPPRLSAEVDDKTKQVDLIISSAAVSDSALYYCALQPTVTGNPAALYKKFHTVLLY